jgi:dTDP-glucose 4,6-dehydratase
MKGRKIFITGGAGFIGSRLAKALAQDNNLVLFDDLSRGRVDENLKNMEGIEIINGNVLNETKLGEALKGCDMAVHLAAVAGIETVTKKPVDTIEINFTGARNLLRCAVNCGVNKVLLASTSEVYGAHTFHESEENTTSQGPMHEPRWGYSVSKLASEHLATAYHNQYGLKITTLRFFNIYGPGQLGEGAIHNFIMSALRDEPLTIFGNGHQIRAWCYISDCVEGIKLCMDSEKVAGHAVNIGNPNATISIRNLANTIKEMTGSKSEIVYTPREGFVDVFLRVPSIKKAEGLLGFEPKIDLQDGIRKTIDWISKNRLG